eukprot:TRINITY_DN15101_c1_g1_i1.p1 TRINITY_DN15101_c1_g1~~TRINITY_DN15101_c1_g1_i1.p1  ORF type:complete len:348 (+),score=96.23 TRINITY_DN15101_c1_g1_i1:37-1044(+)
MNPETSDAVACSRKELSLYMEARKAGVITSLFAFYRKPVWCTPFHAILASHSRRHVRCIIYALKKAGLEYGVIIALMGYVKVDLVQEVSLAQRGRTAEGSATFSLRPVPTATKLYIRTTMLPMDSIHTLYAGFGDITVADLPSHQGVTEYEVSFDGHANCMRAAELTHPKLIFSSFRREGFEAFSSKELVELAASKPGAFDTNVAYLTVDNLPYWTTAEQITNVFSEHGTVREVRFATNDINGCHFGCCQVLMGTHKEMAKAEEQLDGKRMNGNVMVIGILGRDGTIRSSKGPPPKSLGGDINLARLNFTGAAATIPPSNIPSVPAANPGFTPPP